MPKTRFIDIPVREKVTVFEQVGNKKGIPAFAVEKDWWVVETLAAIFDMEVARHLIFKGGTSLSKAWNLIQRFSEDLDLAIDRSFLGFDGFLSKNQRTKLRKEASSYTSNVFFIELQKKFEERNIAGLRFNILETKESDQDPRIIEIYYPNAIRSPGYLEPRIQIEVGCRSLREPFTLRTFTSLVDEEYAEMDLIHQPISVPSVNPERTFLEKIFLLHEEFQKPMDKIRVDRLSRHLYDVYHLSRTTFADEALNNQELFETIVEHRYEFTRISGVDYNGHNPKRINPVPIPEVVRHWKADYSRMLEDMIYEADAPSFDVIMKGLIHLKERINSLSWGLKRSYPILNISSPSKSDKGK